jgi:short-subunit dehydrogenase
MGIKLKPLNEQVIVITGASSGIGLATALMAAERGAKVVLSARSDEVLDDVVRDIAQRGGQAFAVHADVRDATQLEALAAAASAHFGRIDTWVNNAGVAIYGRLDEVADEDSRKLFDTNFWGVVYGSRVALRYLKKSGGALINVGSEVSDAFVPLLGMYSASKHAVKGYTDALRVEIQDVDKAEVAITLIQPTATDTPFAEHARNYRPNAIQLPSPQIDPEKVARAICDAAESPTREVGVGAMAKLNKAVARVAPSLGDKMAAKYYDKLQKDEPATHRAGALEEPSRTGRVRGSDATTDGPPSSHR